jgi:hypothetical protein
MRINRGNKQNGYATSVSVGMHNPDFDSYIENGIRPVISALKNKGYLTLSSCEGHGITDDTRVVICFGHEGMLSAFKEALDPLTSLGLVMEHLKPQDYMEQSTPYTKAYDAIPELRKQGISVREKMTDLECTNCLNKLFNRGYKSYYLLRLVIVPGTDRVNAIKAMYYHWLRKDCLINTTAQVIHTVVPYHEA